MQVDDKLISYLENLSCLTLSESEKKSMTEDFQKTLIDISRIKELGKPQGTENVLRGDTRECSSPFDDVNVFREDDVCPSLDRSLILKNAPVKNDEFFMAPKTVE
ncbi:MAG: Asp-tRNA(Asn)/Glu-tRNA(Gln) amidotransferase subunit GatC [Treponema sp.]|nr:Asp-tRNA(Asn)/Glu-tRNA(Gln) amidotransferase subunit GatC [Treponema sp.]